MEETFETILGTLLSAYEKQKSGQSIDDFLENYAGDNAVSEDKMEYLKEMLADINKFSETLQDLESAKKVDRKTTDQWMEDKVWSVAESHSSSGVSTESVAAAISQQVKESLNK